MTSVIAMYRGVNLGKRRVKMDALRALHESLGCINPRTYVQSGNVVFQTKEKNLAKRAAKIEKAFEAAFGFQSDLILRTAKEMKDVIERNPFNGRDGIEPAKLLVTFLEKDPGKEAAKKFGEIKITPEEAHLIGSEMYVYFCDGIARSKFPASAVDRALKVTGTARNWNSVTKLFEMASGAE